MQLSNHINNPFIWFHVPLNLSIKPIIKTLAQILTELWPFNYIGRRWGHLGFTKMYILHTLLNLWARPLLTHINHQKSLYNISTLWSIFSIFLLAMVTLVSSDNYGTPKHWLVLTVQSHAVGQGPACNPPVTASVHPLPHTVPLSPAVYPAQLQRLMYSRIKHLCRTFLGSQEAHKSIAWQLGHMAVVAQWHLYPTNCNSWQPGTWQKSCVCPVGDWTTLSGHTAKSLWQHQTQPQIMESVSVSLKSCLDLSNVVTFLDATKHHVNVFISEHTIHVSVYILVVLSGQTVCSCRGSLVVDVRAVWL